MRYFMIAGHFKWNEDRKFDVNEYSEVAINFCQMILEINNESLIFKKRWECSGLSRQFGVVLRVMFLGKKWQHKWILKISMTGTNWKTNCDVPFKTIIKGKPTQKSSQFGFLMLTASGARDMELLSSTCSTPWSHLQDKQALHFHNLSFPHFPAIFVSRITAVYNKVRLNW